MLYWRVLRWPGNILSLLLIIKLTGKVEVPASPRFYQLKVVVHPDASGGGHAGAEEEHAGQGGPLAARQMQLRDLEGRQAQDHDVDKDVWDDHAKAVAGLGDAVAFDARDVDVKRLSDRGALEDVYQHARQPPHECQHGEHDTAALHEPGREQPPVQGQDTEFSCQNGACVDDLGGI